MDQNEIMIYSLCTFGEVTEGDISVGRSVL